MNTLIRKKKRGLVVLTLGFIIYLGTQLYFANHVFRNRTAPVEPDDAYTYIARSLILETCGDGKCAAIRDLRDQLAPNANDDYDVAYPKYREYNRVIMNFHPLYSFLLAKVNRTLTHGHWEAAYRTFWITGAVLVSLGLALFLLCFFNTMQSGIALAILSQILLPNQGLHYIVPANMTLALALIAFYAVVRGNPWVQTFTVVVSTPVLLGFHGVGRLYAMLLVACYLIQNRKRLTPQVWLVASVGVIFVVTSVLAKIWITFPDLRLLSDPLAPGQTPIKAIADNIFSAGKFVRALAMSLGGMTLVVGLVALGLRHNHRTSRSVFHALIAPLLILPLIALGHVLPGYPAELFSRVWIPVVAILVGLYATGLEWIALNFATAKAFLKARWLILALVLALAFDLSNLVIRNTFLASTLPWTSLRAMAQYMISRNDRQYEDHSAKTALENTAPNDRIAYFAEEPMHFFFSRGLLDRRAYFQPAHLAPRLPADVSLAVLSFSSPRFSIDSDRKIRIDSTIPLEITLKNLQTQPAVISIGTSSTITLAASQTLKTVTAPSTSGTVQLECLSCAVELVSASAPSARTLKWPWNKNVRIYTLDAPSGQIQSGSTFLVKALQSRVDIIDDSGNILVARVLSDH